MVQAAKRHPASSGRTEPVSSMPEEMSSMCLLFSKHHLIQKYFLGGIHVPVDSREIFLCGGDVGGVVRGEVPVDVVELDAV